MVKQPTWVLYDLYLDWRGWGFSLTHQTDIGRPGGLERCLVIGPLVIEWRDAEQMQPDGDMR
jgi:hypothetical protein